MTIERGAQIVSCSKLLCLRQVDNLHKVCLNHLREFKTQSCYEFMSLKCYYSSQISGRWKKIMSKDSTQYIYISTFLTFLEKQQSYLLSTYRYIEFIKKGFI